MSTELIYLDNAKKAFQNGQKSLARLIINTLLKYNSANIELWRAYSIFENKNFLLMRILAILLRISYYIPLKSSRLLEKLQFKLLSSWANYCAQTSVFFLFLGYFALNKQYNELLILSWEPIELNLSIEDQKALAQAFFKQKNYAKARVLAQRILNKRPDCFEMQDLLQAAALYLKMQG